MIFARNLRSPTMGSDNLIGHVTTLYFKELLLMGGWTRISDNGDAAWANCALVNATGGAAAGFQVRGVTPSQVYSTAGSFTAGMVTDECAIFLRAVNAHNTVAARITRFIDANNVEIDLDSAPPGGWVDEGGLVPNDNIPGRIISPKTATLTSPTAWTLLQAPSGNNQARVLRGAVNTVTCFARPKGGAGTATEIPAAGMALACAAATRMVRFNAVFDGRNALIYYFGSLSTHNGVAMWGELDEVPAADTYPGFIVAYTDFTALYAMRWPMAMLNGAVAAAEIAAYITSLKAWSSQNYYYLNTNTMWRLQNGHPGKAALYSPLVVLANTLTVGGCIRGRLPLIRIANARYETFRPIDAAGAWLHLAVGFVVPRNGINDQMPLITWAS